MPDSIDGVIDRIEGKLAIIIFNDGQRIELPIANLPANACEGDAGRLFFKLSKRITKQRQNAAKKLLNSIQRRHP